MIAVAAKSGLLALAALVAAAAFAPSAAPGGGDGLIHGRAGKAGAPPLGLTLALPRR